MSDLAQPTLDGKPAPPPPVFKSKGGRPRLPLHLQTLKHERAREAHDRRRWTNPHYGRECMRKRARLRRITSPPLPFIKVGDPPPPWLKMRNLLDWHSTCPGSQIFDREQESSDEEPDDEHRLLSSPLNSHKLSDHHDE